MVSYFIVYLRSAKIVTPSSHFNVGSRYTISRNTLNIKPILCIHFKNLKTILLKQ